MAQRSYGSITIVDTNDIQRFYVQYAKNNSSATAPSSGWSQTRPEWQNGTYIWQRTVAKRQGVALTGSDYGTPVCITGEKGQQGIQGNTGKGISSIVTTYCNYAQGTPVSSYSGWSSSVPAYDSTKPNYWVKTVVNYTSGNPSTTIYKDLGITEATQKANLAVTTANTAEANSIQAIAIADGKNKIYYANTFNPASDSSVYNNGDTLFYKTNNGTIMYVYDSTYSDATSGHWRQQQFEENAIANLAITNAKINDLHGNKITANTIAGNKIIAHDITANQLATNAIQSSNYTAGTAPYSTAGTFLDLTQGNIYTPNFGVNNTAILENNQIKLNVGAYIKGSIYAYNGTIGSNTRGNNPNYWYIGDYQDYNQNNSALIKGYGTATIQLGNTSTWRLNTNRIHTAWYDDNDSTNSFRLHYLNFNSEYWDLGFHVPTSVSDKFIYIRKTSTENSLAVLQSAINDNANGTNTYWNYQFYVTNDGSLYAKNIYIKDTNGNDVPVGGSDGVYLLKSGGTITGNLQVNGSYLNKDGNALTLQTNLASTTAGTFTGNTSSAISIGVTGTLPSTSGGTGNVNWNQGGVVYIDGSSPKKLLSTAAGTSSYLLQSNGTGAPTWINPATLTVAAATKATQDGNGKVIATTYLPLTGGNVTGPVNFGDSVSIDDLTAGTLIVTGSSSFTNNAQFNTINGVTVGSSPKFTDTTYTFDGTYNASSNKAATVSTVTNAINALDVSAIAGATNKTLTSISETDGKISATYSNISITKSQVSDFPTSMPASDVSAWAKASTKPTYKQNEILPLQSKTFTNVIGTANSWAGATFFYGSIKPATWGEIWRIKYRIKVFVPGQPNYNQMADVMISGRAGDLRSYASLNTIGAYYVCYYHVLYRMKEAGFNNEYGHSLGIRFYSAYNPTDTNYKRTIDVEILETENCTFNFYDNCLLYADIPGTGSTNYNAYSEMDFVNNGLQETGDSNDVNYYNRQYYGSRTTSAALYRYQFCLTKSDGTLIPVNSVNNSVATNKTLTTESFDPFGDIFFWASTSTYSAGVNVGNSNWYRQYLADLRYSFNCGGYDTTPTLTARAPLYLVATPQTDGTAKLYTQPLSMELPTSADGLIYIYLGRVYEDTKPYRVVLSPKHPIYEYRNGAVRLYTGLKSETAASGGTNVSLVTTGQKYLWNSKTNNTGTVTSVAASGSGGITISGSPITTSGTLAIGLNLSTAINGLGEGTSAANRDDYAVVQYAGGGTSTTTYHRRKLSNVFKALIADDIPNLAWSKITSGNDDLKAIEALTGTSGLLKKTAANTWTLDTSAYVTSSGVTSITLTQGTGISIGSSGTAITSTGTRTISLADNYGDTKNPYASKTARYVLAAPAAANGVPSFRALTKEDVGLNNVLNYGQVTAIGQGDNGTLRVWTGDPTSTSTDDYEDIAITITAYNQSTVSKAGALNLSAAVGSTSKPVYFKADGKPYEISYTIEKSVPSNAVFTDTWNKVSTTQDGYVTKLPGNTTTFLRGDGSWGTPVDTTYTFDGTYNASSNKAATVSTVTNAINALDGNLNSTTPGAGKTLTAFSQTDGKVSATFGDISITKSQISDFPTSLTPTSHTHGNIQNGGTLQTNDITIANGDKLIVTDYSDSNKIARTSISFDGSTATKALTQKGTWETFNNYSLPLAANGTRGGVQIGYSSSGKNYAVQLSSEKMYVNVPWTDTTYSAGTGLSLSGTTFSLADNYGDTKNPYASKTANYVLAAPDGNNGTPSFRNLVFRDIKPLQSKTYTSVVMTANNDPNGWVYFAKFVPTSITDLAYVKFRVRAEAAGTNYSYNDSFVEYWIRSSAVQGYTTYNKIKHTDYRAFYSHSLYRATDTGIQNEYGHLLGIRFTSSWNPATAANARTVIIDILEIENCTITFFDSMVKYADAPGTGSTNYAGRSDYDGTTQGITMSGDRNDVNYYNRNYYGCRTTSAALYRYQLCLTKLDRTLIPINSVNNSIATNKTLTTESFDPFGDILYWASTTTYNAGANVGDGWYSQYLADLRYSFNVGGYNTTSTLVGRKPLYLVCIPQDDGLAKLDTNPLIQVLPTVEDGKLYIYLGQVYPDTYPYRVYLTLSHPVYIYQNGGIQLYKRNEKLSLKVKTDREPYLFRASGGDGADRVEECIVGGSVAWNQLTRAVSYGTSWAVSSGTKTVTGEVITASNPTARFMRVEHYVTGALTQDHKYLAKMDVKCNFASKNIMLGINITSHQFEKVYTVSTADAWTSYETIFNVSYSPVGKSCRYFVQDYTEDYTGDELSMTKPQLIDLTAIFGSTIADYIYSLEQSTAGAGVQWFRKYFPEDYYAYSAPTLQSVSGLQSHDTVGFNQFNGEYTSGMLFNYQTGVIGSQGGWNCSDKIKALPNTAYYIYRENTSQACIIGCWDENDTYLGYIKYSNGNQIVTTKSGTAYVRIEWVGSAGNVCFNLSDPLKNGTYEPYVKHSYPLDSDVTLRGIFKLDSNNQIYADGDIYHSDGTVDRNCYEDDLGAIEWSTRYTGSTNKTLSGNLTNKYNGYMGDFKGMLSSKYTLVSGTGGVGNLSDPDNCTVGLYYYSNSSDTTPKIVYLIVPVNETPSGSIVYYKATPTTETAAPYISLQMLDPHGTEEFVSTGIVPVGHYSEYPQIRINTTNIQNPYTLATTSAYGFMSANDKVKLNNIATGAEVNQNAFSNIKIGSSTVAADTKTDTLEFIAGNYISLTPDTTNDKITIGVKDVTTTLNTSANLPTANAVKSYVDNAISNLNISNYVTLNTTQTISGTKTFTGGISVKSSTTTNACNINYNSSLNALVFSFA